MIILLSISHKPLRRNYRMPIRCVNGKKARRGSKVILTGVNGNVIMSGCRDADPDDARREALAESGIISQLKLAVGSSGFDG